jgi:hypothetical protein
LKEGRAGIASKLFTAVIFFFHLCHYTSKVHCMSPPTPPPPPPGVRLSGIKASYCNFGLHTGEVLKT